MLRFLGMVCALVCLLVAGPARAGFDPSQREEIGTIARDYLLAHPEVVEEAGKRLQERRQADEEKQQAQVIADSQDRFVTPGLTPVLGNPAGDVTVVLFSDYNCGYCRAVVPMLEQLVQEDPGVRIVVREFPILGPGSDVAARAALAANKQGKYADFHHGLFAGDGPVDPDSITALAKDIGLDMTRFETDRASPAVQAEIRASHDLGRKLGIRGTPGFVIGTRVYPGAMPLELMKQAVDEARTQQKAGPSDQQETPASR